jgi:16S rRNA (uracil1498-N3)-methyltransferase
VGDIELSPAQARHLHTVLRLRAGDVVEAFDDAGTSAEAIVIRSARDKVTLRVSRLTPAAVSAMTWTVAASLPKGPRADWMVEKLAELGTADFIPLIAERSVTVPEGKQKIERWSRLAAEASRQSGRRDVMRIGPLTPVREAAAIERAARWVMSMGPEAVSARLAAGGKPPRSLLMLVGPEGGWTKSEAEMLESAGFQAVKLGGTVLRVETAAIAAAAVAAAWAAEASAEG